MKLRTVALAFLLTFMVGAVCSCGLSGASSDLTISAIQDLNTDSGEINDHADDWQSSHLEPNFRQAVEVGIEKLRIKAANYPRIKKINDESYIMFYQDGQVGWNIYYSTSTDLIHWNLGLKLFNSVKINVEGDSDDDRCYSTCDAIVLDNGDIMAIASFRSNRHFRLNNKFNGLAMRISSDGGKTWGKERVIYTGSNWEPSILQLPSGEIQVYFTHSAPKNQPQIEAGLPASEIVASSGTGMIRSLDRGKTWIPYVTEPPYAAQRVCQQYTDTIRDIKVFTDQMPVAILLNKSNTIALATESKFIVGTEEVYHITMAYNDDNWAKDLGIDEEGPADKQTNMYLGAAPYIRQFPSGETVLSNNRNSRFQMRIGDALARTFTKDPVEPLLKTGYWGSLELISSHDMLGTMPYCIKVNGQNKNTLQISQNYLNHRIDLKTASVKVDGNNKDWTNNTDALFVGSASQAQVALRPAKDDKNVYLLAEVLDMALMAKENVEISLVADGAAKPDETSLKIKATVGGKIEVYRWNGSSFLTADEEAAKAIKYAVKVKGTVGKTEDEDEGYIAEIGIPRSLLPLTNGKLRCYVNLKNQEPDGRIVDDKIEECYLTDPTTWIPLVVD